MRSVINYEIILSGEEEERLLLTFDWQDLPHLPRNVSGVVFFLEASQFVVTFEDNERWEEICFENTPAALHDVIKNYKEITIVGLSEEVELFASSSLEIR